MTETEQTTELEHWRSRYFDECRAWERKEQDWSQLEQSLRRALVRISLAGDGLNRELDEQLKALREAVRQSIGAEELDRRVESIARLLLELDRGPPTGGKPKEAQPFWRRWRQGEPAPTPRPAEAEHEEVPERVRATLLKLLNQLSLPEELAAAADPLRRQLQAPLPLTRLPELIEAITALVLESSQEENAELENFLKLLTGRLADIQAFLQGSDARRREVDAEHSALDQAIRAGVADLHNHLSSAADLDQLKSAVSGQLEGIVQHLGSFMERQRHHSGEAEQRVAELSERLQKTEQETERLRASLIQQQLRAQMDTLTGVANREAYRLRLDYEFARWQRYQTPLSLIVGDIDHFKRINDRFGHSTGDKVLRAVARILQANMRKTDLLARYGGEEFVILMPETSLEQAAQAAEKLRQAVEARPFHAGEERIAMSLSFGVAEFNGGDDTDAVFNRADQALYQAKGSGRNRVVAGSTRQR